MLTPKSLAASSTPVAPVAIAAPPTEHVTFAMPHAHDQDHDHEEHEHHPLTYRAESGVTVRLDSIDREFLLKPRPVADPGA